MGGVWEGHGGFEREVERKASGEREGLGAILGRWVRAGGILGKMEGSESSCGGGTHVVGKWVEAVKRERGRSGADDDTGEGGPEAQWNESRWAGRMECEGLGRSRGSEKGRAKANGGWTAFEVFRKRLWVILGCAWASLGNPATVPRWWVRDLMGVGWYLVVGLSGASAQFGGLLGGRFVASWALFWASWGPLGASWGPLGGL